MLGGRISNQDEEEVEDELAALEAELAGKSQVQVQQPLPNVPDTELQSQIGVETPPDRLPERARQVEQRQAMLAS